jgi:hypothetical protein
VVLGVWSAQTAEVKLFRVRYQISVLFRPSETVPATVMSRNRIHSGNL